jgi:hypothetical protein
MPEDLHPFNSLDLQELWKKEFSYLIGEPWKTKQHDSESELR